MIESALSSLFDLGMVVKSNTKVIFFVVSIAEYCDKYNL